MKKTLYFLIFIVFLLLNLSTCEEIFTASPFSGLDRDPSDFDLDRKIEYAEQALASGNLTYIEKAFDALDAENSTDSEICLLTAKCANELAGMPEIYAAMYDSESEYYLGDIDFNNVDDMNELNDFANSLDKNYLTPAASYYIDADADNASMNATDYFFAGLCELFDTSTSTTTKSLTDGDMRTDPATNDRVEAAYVLLEISEAMLSEGDVKAGLDSFTTTLQTYYTDGTW